MQNMYSKNMRSMFKFNITSEITWDFEQVPTQSAPQSTKNACFDNFDVLDESTQGQETMQQEPPIPEVTPLKCTVCLEDLHADRLWLGCHTFCTTCIGNWVISCMQSDSLSRPTCPECRRKIPRQLCIDSIVKCQQVRHDRRADARRVRPTMRFTTDGRTTGSVSTYEMNYRIENIE